MGTPSQVVAKSGGDVPAAQTSLQERLNAALDDLQRARAEAMGWLAEVQRCRQLEWLAEVEAAWWEVLSEHSPTRVQWRAALVAREHALHAARCWRHRAEVGQRPEPACPALPEEGVA